MLGCRRLAVLLCAAAGGAAPAQDSPSLDRVVVTGVRASAESAQERKRQASGIVDGVVAADIHKLPDLGVGDAVQRITGVQVARDRGEGTAFAVRGLSQVETLLNGREVFTAGSGRTLDLSDFPSEMLSAIDVHKTASADQLEGGLGGSIDLRTRRPFDFAGDATVLSARRLHGHLVRRSADQASVMLSRRTRADGGEFGLLLNLVAQDRAWREDLKGTGAPVGRTDLLPGTTVFAPSGTSETVSLGTRRRLGGSALLQWRPAPTTELYAEAHAAELRTRQDSHQVNVSAGSGFVPGSLDLFEGTNDLRRITWTDAPVSLLSFARDTLDRTRQLAVGARHDGERWRWSADLSHTKSVNRLFFSGPFHAATVAEFHHDLSGRVPSTAVAGTDLLDPANLRVTGLAYRVRPFEGSLAAARVDGAWQAGDGLLDGLAFGWRRADRRADNTPGLVFGDVAVSGLTAADVPDRVLPTPFGDFLDGRAPSVGNFLIGDLSDARDPAALRQAYGVTVPLPVAGDPLGVWGIRERSDALYLRADWGSPARKVDGQFGLRAVHTRVRLDGFRTLPGTGGVAPLQADSTGTDWLPSATLRQALPNGWQWRAAVSRTVTRPNFDQLSPSLRLLRNPVDPALNQGASGNPELRPVRSHNLDLAFERLVDPASAVALTLFWKRVDGFVANASLPEVYDGETYLVSRPYNSDPARVRGAEFAWQAFFDGLRGPWRGLGVQANYTFVDSRTPDRRLGREVPLQNLSRHSLNLIGLYERGPWSARLAWNWRSDFLSGVSSVVGLGVQPVYTRGHGWVDGAIAWQVHERATVALEGSNL
ncbi:MAG: TonB-dependent receptor, partial [Piscinibacter sp.]|uniref:TonB-dependent receptor n=1 Tax=Piscinibacter sp. TaxID=1903157 RepID=UPI003D12554B